MYDTCMFPTTSRQMTTRPLNVVVIDEELPYPLLSGKRLRTMGLLSRLAGRHRLTYVCHCNADANEADTAAAYFAQQGIRTEVVERPTPPKSGLRFYGRLAANLFSPLPYSVSSHTSSALRSRLKQIAEKQRVDLWHVEWTPYAQSLVGLPGRRLVMAHNVESTIWQRYWETESNPFKRWYIRQQWLKMRRFERTILRQANLTVAVSDLDAQRFRQELGVPRVEVVDNGVDPSYFCPDDSPRRPEVLLFLGSLDWRPNQDAARQLLDLIFPVVQARVPQAELWLVGRNPPDWLVHAARRPGVYLHASVPDVRPFLRQAGQLVVPLRVGGGSRLKILEALACGTPVVSTRIGAEGLHLEHDLHLVQVERIEEMAEAILASIHDRQRMDKLTLRGRQQVLRLYDWDSLAQRLESLWQRCVRECQP
jgi:glycosyltransferase involved in cell wall biosynthesis